MFDRKDPYERDEDQLCEDLNAGRITQAEYNRQMREINQQRREDYAQAREDAMDRFEADYGY